MENNPRSCPTQAGEHPRIRHAEIRFSAGSEVGYIDPIGIWQYSIAVGLLGQLIVPFRRARRDGKGGEAENRIVCPNNGTLCSGMNRVIKRSPIFTRQPISRLPQRRLECSDWFFCSWY